MPLANGDGFRTMSVNLTDEQHTFVSAEARRRSLKNSDIVREYLDLGRDLARIRAQAMHQVLSFESLSHFEASHELAEAAS